MSFDPENVQLWNNEDDGIFHAHGERKKHFVSGEDYDQLLALYRRDAATLNLIEEKIKQQKPTA
jgi:hypothetical protein